MPTLAVLAISAETEFSRAFYDAVLPVSPPVADTPAEPKPGTPAFASAVTDAFQPPASELFSFSALCLVVLLLSVLVMPTEYVNSCASVDVMPFQYPDALPVLSFSSLIDLTPPSS